MVGFFKKARAGSVNSYLRIAIEQLDVFDNLFSEAAINLQEVYNVQVDFGGGRLIGISGIDGVIRLESKLINDREGICYSVLFYDEGLSVPSLVRRPIYLLNLHTDSPWADSSGQVLTCDHNTGEHSAKTVVEIVTRVLDSQLQMNTLRAGEFLKSLPKIA